MSEKVPIVISGQLTVGQECILMSIVNSTPYYMVTDINGVPYFQPLYFDVNLGLDVFQNSSARVTMSLGKLTGTGSDQITATITNLAAPPLGGNFLPNSTIGRIVAPNSLPNVPAPIPIDDVGYINPTIVACGYQYTLNQAIKFYLSNTWYPNPNSQAVGSIATTICDNFYVFPVVDVVDSSKAAVSESLVFSTIYNDVLGFKPTTFLFANVAAWDIGAGLPYQYCAVTDCGKSCYGMCNGNFATCHRNNDESFSCLIEASAKCKAIFTIPFILVASIFIVLFFVMLFRVRHNHMYGNGGTAPGSGELAYAMPMRTKFILSAIISVPSIIIVLLIFLITTDEQNVDRVIRKVCSPVGYE